MKAAIIFLVLISTAFARPSVETNEVEQPLDENIGSINVGHLQPTYCNKIACESSCKAQYGVHYLSAFCRFGICYCVHV